MSGGLWSHEDAWEWGVGWGEFSGTGNVLSLEMDDYIEVQFLRSSIFNHLVIIHMHDILLRKYLVFHNVKYLIF